MNVICPVCNCFWSLHAVCPLCGEYLEDAGRLADYFGDYSPYREIDDAKRTNGLPDLVQQLCVHVAWCPNCRQERRVAIPEVTDADVYAMQQLN